MIEQRRPITIEMFRPDAMDGSSHIHRNLARLMREIGGNGKLRLYWRTKNGGDLPEKTAREIDDYVIASIGRLYSLPDQLAQQFYIQQQRQALGVIGYFGKILPDQAQELEGKDEISMLSDRPSDLFRLLSMPPNQIDPALAYDTHRHALLSIISGRNNVMILHGRSRTLLSDSHNHFNQALFAGPKGAGQRISLKSIHDDETNEVIGFPDKGQRILPTAHLKQLSFTVRLIETEGVGLVYTSPRKKDDSVSIIKSIATALDEGRDINTDPIKDRLGMMFVLMQDNVSPEQLADLIVSVVKSGPKEVVRIDSEDEVDQKRGQSPNFRFNSRRIIWFKDSLVPLELVFFDYRNYLNSILEVGTRDPETGLYMGQAHKLFELRRARKVARVLFPKEVYTTDLEGAFVRQSKQSAQELRDRYLK